MSEMTTARVEGLSELEDMLMQRAPKEAKTAMRRANRAGLKVFQSAIENKAPVKSGKLKSEIEISTNVSGGDGDGATGGIVGVTGPAKDVFYAMFQEMGTVRQPPRPFVRPAFDEEAHNAIAIFEEELAKQLEALEER